MGHVGCDFPLTACYIHLVLTHVQLLSAGLCKVEARQSSGFFCGMLGGEVISVLYPVCSSWDAMRDVQSLRCVGRPPIVMHGCVFGNAKGCCCGLGQAPSTLGPPAPTSSRDGVHPRCFLPSVLRSMCCMLGVFTLGEGVNVSAFP